MRNLIFILKRYYNFFIFLLLEIICLSIFLRNNRYQQSSWVNSSRSISGALFTQKQQLFGFFSLRAVNDSLVRENARLKQQLGIPQIPNHLKDTSYMSTTVRDSVKQTTHYRYIPCKVLNNSVDLKYNFLTLNAGYKQGIRKNFAVICDKGIVGRITHVSENYSVAASLLSDKFVVSAMVGDGTVGKLYWDGDNPNLVTLSGIPQSVKVKQKDSVLTSGFGIFPENILIGRAAEKSKNGTTYKVWLSHDFRKLHYVYVIEDITQIERILLEDSTQSE